jgi:phage recombination protein Bet
MNPQNKTTVTTEAKAAERPSFDANAWLEGLPDKAVEFVPFQEEKPIKLSPVLVKKFLCKPTKQGKICDDIQAIRFCMLCQSRGLNPWIGDAYIVGYDTKDGPEFSLITAVQALIKRAEVHPRYNGMEYGVIVQRGDEVIDVEGEFTMPNDTILGGWCRVYQKGIEHHSVARVNLRNYMKPFGVWLTNPFRMIAKVAQAQALRHAFPNSLGGMYLEDIIEDAESAVSQVQAATARAEPLPVGRTSFKTPYKPSPQPEAVQERQDEPQQEQRQETPKDPETVATPVQEAAAQQEPPQTQDNSDLFGAGKPVETQHVEPAATDKPAKGKKAERTFAQKGLHNRIVKEKITAADLTSAMIQAGVMGEEQKEQPKIESLGDRDCDNVHSALDEIQGKQGA